VTELPPARVFLVDDHPLVRESLASLIERQSGLTVCGEAGGADEALAAIGTSRPDVAIVDLSLGGRPGLELVRDLKLMHPGVAVLVLSMHDENLYAERALRAGARGYVMKREATRNVTDAIRCVLDGRVYLSARMATALATKFVGGAPETDESPVARLSDRELEVFRLLGQGMATRQIADALHVSAKTVQAFSARIKEKLGLSSSTELLREAIRWAEEQRGTE
jgi:DNA-binding NarL/FixJ family response regulator